MNTRKWMLLAGIGAVLIVAIALVPGVLAQGPTSGYGRGWTPGGAVGRGYNLMANNPGGFDYRRGPGNVSGPRFGLGSRWGGPDKSMVAVAAEQLGLTRTELIAELQAGKTIAQVAEAQGVALETIVDAFVAPRVERLTELVDRGQLTQEQADAMLATMRAHVSERLQAAWSSRGPGCGNVSNFVDEDGDGVCDHAGTGLGPGRGNGPGFVDEDGDGVCDHAASGGQFGQRGGRMMGRWKQ